MAYPRSQTVSARMPGFYHCVSRCVRRAFLCGQDRHSGRSFEHRRVWIEQRLLRLAECFAVSVYAYAVMANHLHVVLRLDPSALGRWSGRELAERWLRAFPGRSPGGEGSEDWENRVRALLADADRLAIVRQRLGCLSWFMRALNEPIARAANREDGCTGRFWEGRFKCQALLDERAVLSSMTYVDLNPVRAGVCEDLEHSAHTSVRRRMEKHASAPENVFLRRTPAPAARLAPVAGLSAEDLLPLSESEYLALVRWSGEQWRPGKRGRLASSAETIPIAAPGCALTGNPHQWLRQVLWTESGYYRAIGSAEALLQRAAELGQRWLKGLGAARALAVSPQRS